MSLQRLTGILLINLGTPEAPNKSAVRRYLREFLSDPRVIDIHRVVRWILLHFFILPFRPKQSAHAYQQIWTDKGSPLLEHSNELTDKLDSALGNNFAVALGMRYGKPSIENALQHLIKKQCEKIIILPLFPQYSSAASGSAIEKTLTLIKQQKEIPSISIISDFFNQPAFIAAYQNLLKKELEDFPFDLLLFSYHGLPIRQLNGCGNTTCAQTQSCPPMQNNHRFCYRSQCYTTSYLLARELTLKEHQYQTAFQSRLGKTPWIKPYTDQCLIELSQQGIKNLAIACPSFVVDCLETLEEIGIRAKNQWRSLGGENFKLIPCLNSNPVWINALKTMIEENEI